MSEQETQSVNTKSEFALFLAVIALIVSAVHFAVGAWHAEQTNHRIDRLESIERIDSIGRRK